MNKDDIGFLSSLETVIGERIEEHAANSYTASLAASGEKRVAQKVGEEAVELALASVAGDRSEVLDEAADLIYHLLVLLRTRDIRLADVVATLQDRHTQ